MNAVNLIGRLTRDPESRTADSGTDVCRMRLAVAPSSRDANPVYIDVTAFAAQAEACAAHLRKGHLAGIEGRLEYSEWTAPDGSTRSKHEVVGRRIEFLGRPTSELPALEVEEPADDGDRDAPMPKEQIPF